MSKLWSAYDATVEKITDNEFKKYTQKINDALASYIEMKQEEQKKYNMLSCQKQEERHRSPNIHGCKRTYADKLATYDASTNTCTVTVIDYDRGGCGAAFKWREEKRTTKTVPMPTISRGKLVFGESGGVDSEGGIKDLVIQAKQSKDANGNQL